MEKISAFEIGMYDGMTKEAGKILDFARAIKSKAGEAVDAIGDAVRSGARKAKDVPGQPVKSTRLLSAPAIRGNKGIPDDFKPNAETINLPSSEHLEGIKKRKFRRNLAIGGAGVLGLGGLGYAARREKQASLGSVVDKTKAEAIRRLGGMTRKQVAAIAAAAAASGGAGGYAAGRRRNG